ncbi:hypothetical protein ACFOZ0_34395 [Streptomyces yaanensis]|uniref:Uncharacterized protein n=1 Tax=Streptomyces yaanensis TaxID=1142239 RepID=A0ABV7SQ15_9ACTN|nr:hypothetical protein [Streptomyces sp. CGMCC 4.7035]WNC00552.1 hypothetical protein Q2K21_22200 [Streptomyces sp. CGMCC 4.7035]
MGQYAVSVRNGVVKNADENQPTVTDQYSEVAAVTHAQHRDESHLSSTEYPLVRHARDD